MKSIQIGWKNLSIMLATFINHLNVIQCARQSLLNAYPFCLAKVRILKVCRILLNPDNKITKERSYAIPTVRLHLPQRLQQPILLPRLPEDRA